MTSFPIIYLLKTKHKENVLISINLAEPWIVNSFNKEHNPNAQPPNVSMLYPIVTASNEEHDRNMNSVIAPTHSPNVITFNQK